MVLDHHDQSCVVDNNSANTIISDLTIPRCRDASTSRDISCKCNWTIVMIYETNAIAMIIGNRDIVHI